MWEFTITSSQERMQRLEREPRCSVILSPEIPGRFRAGFVDPRLAGQQEKYLIAQFKLIRDDKRTSGLSSMMSPAVKNVSDEDISAIAAYLSGL